MPLIKETKVLAHALMKGYQRAYAWAAKNIFTPPTSRTSVTQWSTYSGTFPVFEHFELCNGLQARLANLLEWLRFSLGAAFIYYGLYLSKMLSEWGASGGAMVSKPWLASLHEWVRFFLGAPFIGLGLHLSKTLSELDASSSAIVTDLD